jgi:hypothetical protein
MGDRIQMPMRKNHWVLPLVLFTLFFALPWQPFKKIGGGEVNK